MKKLEISRYTKGSMWTLFLFLSRVAHIHTEERISSQDHSSWFISGVAVDFFWLCFLLSVLQYIEEVLPWVMRLILVSSIQDTHHVVWITLVLTDNAKPERFEI